MNDAWRVALRLASLSTPLQGSKPYHYRAPSKFQPVQPDPLLLPESAAAAIAALEGVVEGAAELLPLRRSLWPRLSPPPPPPSPQPFKRCSQHRPCYHRPCYRQCYHPCHRPCYHPITLLPP